MNSRFRSQRIIVPAVFSILATSATAQASIMGFGNFANFTINQNDSGSPPTVPSSGAIELTNGGSEQRSIFYDTPQDITQFSASFTYQDVNDGQGGFSFILQNDSRGASAVGVSSFFTEGSGFSQIGKSVGVLVNLDNSFSGLFTNGNIGSGENSTAPVNVSSGDPIDVQLSYSGSTLTESLTDTVTSKNFDATYLVLSSIANTVGSSTAFVGIGADAGGSNQVFSNFQFTNAVPEPAGFGLLAAGALAALARRRRRA